MRFIWGGSAAAAVLYAWYATGLAPFSDLAYAALGVPAITALLLYGTLGGFSTSPATSRRTTARAHLDTSPPLGRVLVLRSDWRPPDLLSAGAQGRQFPLSAPRSTISS